MRSFKDAFARAVWAAVPAALGSLLLLAIPAHAQDGAFADTVGRGAEIEPLPLTAVTPARAPKVSGYAIFRETYARDAALTATLHRARVQVEGTVAPSLGYRVLTEYAAPSGPRTASTVSLRDAYIRWTRGAWALQGGQYKTPFTREYVMPLTSLETVEFATVIDTLAPKRDIGVMGEWATPSASLSVGVFNGEGQNASANRDSAMLVITRVTLRPLAPFSIGGAFARYDADSTRYGIEAVAEWGGMYVRSEAVSQHKRGRSRDDYGWYVLGVARVLAPLSLVGRVEDMQRPSLGQARRFSELTGGVIWELPGGRARMVCDLVSRRTGYPRVQRNSLVTQLQVRF